MTVSVERGRTNSVQSRTALQPPPSTELKRTNSERLYSLTSMLSFLTLLRDTRNPSEAMLKPELEVESPFSQAPGLRLLYEGSRTLYPAALQDHQFGIENVDADGAISRIGFIQLQVIDLDRITSNMSKTVPQPDNIELIIEKLALVSASSVPLESCWQATDFQNKKAIIIGALIVTEQVFKGKVEEWVLLQMLHLEVFQKDLSDKIQQNLKKIRGVGLLVVSICEEEQEKMVIFRQAGFRRVANSGLFCMARDPSHPSRSVPCNGDAAYQTQPIPMPQSPVQRAGLVG
ncbi:hypothetical protein FB451DRAFT_404870 [Mycena latifolia]|nr:hypothetical protein FB451DRAFT_404870 [Mycena latifolia]